ncbi:hypothetical protein E2C01_021925 [Portunus trituberculatus]|uniref:Uncharacterized protein n=1 Tax=Portunus trituberculatus TaxID=210409 RepID=A0A5B7E5W9_PORTR|nr:hypothetical protein [Portunus trituberculatus]
MTIAIKLDPDKCSILTSNNTLHRGRQSWESGSYLIKRPFVVLDVLFFPPIPILKCLSCDVGDHGTPSSSVFSQSNQIHSCPSIIDVFQQCVHKLDPLSSSCSGSFYSPQQAFSLSSPCPLSTGKPRITNGLASRKSVRYAKIRCTGS